MRQAAPRRAAVKRRLRQVIAFVLRGIVSFVAILLAGVAIAHFGLAPSFIAILIALAMLTPLIMWARTLPRARVAIDHFLGLDQPAGLLKLIAAVCLAISIAIGLATDLWTVPVAFGCLFIPLLLIMMRRSNAELPVGRIRPCPHCGYNRVNIDTRSKCPECGRSPWM
jgi:hypothetical protein